MDIYKKGERMNINELCEADLIHYKREQRKFFYNAYEKANRRETQTYSTFLKHNYERLKPLFDLQFFARYRQARDYLATVNPQ